jgi:hypothetical protein
MQKESTCVLKGQCHEIFDFRFFHGSVSPLTPAANLPPLIDPVLLIPKVHLVLLISPRIFEKSQDAPKVIFSGAWGKMIYEKILRQKSRDTVPFKALGARPSNHSARSHLKMLVCVAHSDTKVKRVHLEERLRELRNKGSDYDGVCCQEVVL